MKHLIWGLGLLAACNSAGHNGSYVNHTNGAYAIADDTLIVQDSIIINHSGFQKIRNGQLLPQEFKVQRLYELHPVFTDGKLVLDHTEYTKIK